MEVILVSIFQVILVIYLAVLQPTLGHSCGTASLSLTDIFKKYENRFFLIKLKIFYIWALDAKVTLCYFCIPSKEVKHF